MDGATVGAAAPTDLKYCNGLLDNPRGMQTVHIGMAPASHSSSGRVVAR